MSVATAGIAAWHDYMHGGSDPEKLKAMLADDAVFHSPVVHTPQEGKAKVFAYLHAASHVLGNDSFHYVREIVDGDTAVLEFALVLDGIAVNGVDMVRWNAEGKIEDFKVMVRPLKAINKVWEKMGEMLARAG
ncbi:nuclear transport factor 2 family protein [Sphingomonas ursincola]|uniref:nuclear transport factor 2 family protein n=1 Tax=Sphingomonas ursincola TaxID=56361 RepID=UPI0023541FC2|nr:nuclear transport factor 2 family protein [Sphingomonas ursincola]MBY0621539.1 nuclear transport factor 2 family protein [Sphingomonas ursincola]